MWEGRSFLGTIFVRWRRKDYFVFWILVLFVRTFYCLFSVLELILLASRCFLCILLFIFHFGVIPMRKWHDFCLVLCACAEPGKAMLNPNPIDMFAFNKILSCRMFFVIDLSTSFLS